MRKELGHMIRAGRIKSELSKPQFAKQAHISIHYVNHLENENPAARFSERLMKRVVRILDLPPRKSRVLAEDHNRRVRKYRRSLKSA